MLTKRKPKIYSVTLDSEVMAISLVAEPAIESNFVYLAKQKEKKHIVLSSEEKHMVYGPVLIPDFPILRYDDFDGEFYIQFPKDTVEKLAFDFVQNGMIANFTTQHSEDTDGVRVVESWVKTSENDKSKDLGLDCPIGTWFIGAKINDKSIWDDIKNGKMRGFSVESFLNMEEIMLSKNNIEMSKNTETKLETVEVNDDFFSKILDAIKGALVSPSVPEMEANITAEQFVEEIKDEVKSDEIVEDVLKDETEGVAEEIADNVVEDVKDVAPTEEVVEETIQEVIDELNAKIDELNIQIEELKKQNVNLSKENEKLSKRPSTKPVNVKASKASENKFDVMLSILNGSAFK